MANNPENLEKLEDLLVDEERLNEDMLVEIVGKYLRIGDDSGNIIVRPPYNALQSKRKILLTLLGQKARFELDKSDTEWLSPTEISDLSGVKKGTVHPSVRDLAEEGLIESNDGQYRVPVINYDLVRDYIEEET